MTDAIYDSDDHARAALSAEDYERFAGPADECRPVEVDGEVIRVRGGQEMTAEEREMFAEVIRAAKAKFFAEPDDSGSA